MKTKLLKLKSGEILIGEFHTIGKWIKKYKVINPFSITFSNNSYFIFPLIPLMEFGFNIALKPKDIL